jgi:hypothetical protein
MPTFRRSAEQCENGGAAARYCAIWFILVSPKAIEIHPPNSGADPATAGALCGSSFFERLTRAAEFR